MALFHFINRLPIIKLLLEYSMFDRSESDLKFSHLYHDKASVQLGETQDGAFAGQVEAERLYVERLKDQRGKIETLYSKYDSLFKDLKTKESQIKEKDKVISNLQSKCKNLSAVSQESNLFRQHSKEVKTDNITLQRAISQLEQSYAFLHGQYRSKESVSTQRYEDLEVLNDELMSKLRLLSKKYQDKEDQFGDKIKSIQAKYEEALIEGRREKEEHVQEEEMLKNTILQKDEQIKLLKAENECLKERTNELEAYVNELIYESEAKMQQFDRDKKTQMKLLKNEIDALREANYGLQKKWQKLKEEFHVKQASLGQMTLVIEQHEKQSTQAFSQIKEQYTHERSELKEKLIQYESHIVKLERKLADCFRKEQYLIGKVKKYESCMNAKRNLREVQREELDKINMILSLP